MRMLDIVGHWSDVLWLQAESAELRDLAISQISVSAWVVVVSLEQANICYLPALSIIQQSLLSTRTHSGKSLFNLPRAKLGFVPPFLDSSKFYLGHLVKHKKYQKGPPKNPVPFVDPCSPDFVRDKLNDWLPPGPAQVHWEELGSVISNPDRSWRSLQSAGNKIAFGLEKRLGHLKVYQWQLPGENQGKHHSSHKYKPELCSN